MKLALYTSAKIYGPIQTGGVKRFAELTEYVNKEIKDAMLFTNDNEDVLKEHGINNYIILREGKRIGVLPPEVQKILSNKSIVKQIKRDNFDNVVVFDVPPAVGLILLGVRNAVLMIRKDMIGYEKVNNRSVTKWMKICFQWICESICMLKSKKIITQCDYDKNVLKKRHPLLAKMIDEKTAVQINNVNPSWIVKKSGKSIAETNVLWNKQKFTVCFIGGFDNPRKGQDLFLAAATEILKNDSDVQFVLIGGGSKIEEYKKKYESEDIIFLGRQENPLGILKKCDLLVVPSYADSCPNTVMEALYNSVPVVGSRAGGIPEILVDDNALFDLNADDLLKLIIKLKNNNEAMMELKERQKLRKEELTFDWASKIVDIISK